MATPTASAAVPFVSVSPTKLVFDPARTPHSLPRIHLYTHRDTHEPGRPDAPCLWDVQA
jgi:hypothetical protein